MKIYVLDNSVILKILLPEEGSEKVGKLFRLKEKFQVSILVPDIFRYEFFNILLKGMTMENVLKCYHQIIHPQFSILPLEVDLIEEADKLIKKYPKISLYDASYHALAKAYKAVFVTADEKYYAMTKKEGHITLLKDLKLPT